MGIPSDRLMQLVRELLAATLTGQFSQGVIILARRKTVAVP